MDMLIWPYSAKRNGKYTHLGLFQWSVISMEDGYNVIT